MIVNGNNTKIEEKISLEQYLINSGYVLNRIAVELNGNIVPKANYSQVILTNNDHIEIVNFVAGG